MKLTDAKLRTLSTPGKHADGLGLYLEVTPKGAKYWRMKYRFGGKEKRLALGVYPTVSLKDARNQLQAARDQLRMGQDPGELKKAAKTQAAFERVNTLEAVAADWMLHQSARWEPETKARIHASLAADVFPTLGNRPLASIRPGEVMRAVQRIEC